MKKPHYWLHLMQYPKYNPTFEKTLLYCSYKNLNFKIVSNLDR